MAADLNSHHRDTLEKLFTHPSSGNIEWRQVQQQVYQRGAHNPDRRGHLGAALAQTRTSTCRARFMSPTRSTAPIATALREGLTPQCLAMSGVCAGNPNVVALGDGRRSGRGGERGVAHDRNGGGQDHEGTGGAWRNLSGARR